MESIITNVKNIIYSKPFFEFLNEINGNTNSIYNNESYEIINNAFVAQFLNEEDYLQQKSKPPPKFNGFDIVIQFKMHQNSFKMAEGIDSEIVLHRFSELNIFRSINRKIKAPAKKSPLLSSNKRKRIIKPNIKPI